LVTHFDAFGEDRINSSQIVVNLLYELRDDVEVMSLPTVFSDCFSPLKVRLLEEIPQALIMVGQAAGRTSITPEKVAINWKESSTADNNGIVAGGERILVEGQVAYFSKLPIEKIVWRLKGEGFPVATSFSAGAFVCNYLFYRSMEFLNNNNIDIPAGFVHVPCIPKQRDSGGQFPSIEAGVSAKILSRIIDLTMEDRRCE